MEPEEAILVPDQMPKGSHRELGVVSRARVKISSLDSLLSFTPVLHDH